MQSFTVVHFADTDRVVSAKTPQMIVEFGLSNNGRTKFIFEGNVYVVENVVYSSADAATTGARLLELVSAVVGSAEEAVCLLERAEPQWGAVNNSVYVERSQDGDISVQVEKDGNTTACFIQADRVYSGPRDC